MTTLKGALTWGKFVGTILIVVALGGTAVGFVVAGKADKSVVDMLPEYIKLIIIVETTKANKEILKKVEEVIDRKFKEKRAELK